MVLLLRLPPRDAAARGGFGGERYETLPFQTSVAEQFERLAEPWWTVIDAAGSEEAVGEACASAAKAAVADAAAGAPLRRLWAPRE